MFNTLKQGQKFNSYQRKYKNLIKQKNLDLISVGKLNIVNNLMHGSAPLNNGNTIKEGFKGWWKGKQGIVSNELSPVEKKNLEELKRVERLENEFNSTMTLYVVKYKSYLEELISKQSALDVKYKGKIIKYDGQYYYINHGGIARRFSDEAWVSKDNSCPEAEITLDAEKFSKLALGTRMGIGELCKLGGWNATDSGSGTTAWIDNLGYRHLYQDFRNRHKSCPETTKKISAIQFNAIPRGPDWTENDPCNAISLNSPLYDQLVSLNTKLLNIITKMSYHIGRLETIDASLENKVKEQKTILVKKITELKTEREKVRKLKTANETMLSEYNEQELNVSSIRMHHLIWFVIGCTFFGTAYFHMMDQ